jgi:vacuolar-type H+-ATPase subunit D/Vma8
MSLGDEIKEQQTLEQLREALKRAQQQYGRLKVSRDELVEAVYQAAKDATQERHTQRQARGGSHSLHGLAAWQKERVIRVGDVRTAH